MSTSHIFPPEGKEKFTSAGPENNQNTSCMHCMMTTVWVQAHPGYSAAAIAPSSPCSEPLVGHDVSAPQTGRPPSGTVHDRRPPASLHSVQRRHKLAENLQVRQY